MVQYGVKDVREDENVNLDRKGTKETWGNDEHMRKDLMS